MEPGLSSPCLRTQRLPGRLSSADYTRRHRGNGLFRIIWPSSAMPLACKLRPGRTPSSSACQQINQGESVMTRKTYPLLALLALGISLPAAADSAKVPTTKFSLQQCLATALAAKNGKALQIVLKSEGKEAVWEFEIAGKDGKYWDVECSGATGKVIEIEERVMSADDPAFKSKAKVSEAQATQTVLDKYPGKVERVEYEIESNGKVSYEFDLELKSGEEMRVEVDAETCLIVEASHEYLDIGRLSK